jgi:hypothetical protein
MSKRKTQDEDTAMRSVGRGEEDEGSSDEVICDCPLVLDVGLLMD